MHDCEKMPVTFSSYLISIFFCLLMFYTGTANTTNNGGLSDAIVVAVTAMYTLLLGGAVGVAICILVFGDVNIMYCEKHGHEHIRGSSSINWRICGEWSS